MTKYGTKALLVVVAVVLILGLATSGFAQGKWVFGIKGDMTFLEPFQKGGDFSEKWNDEVAFVNEGYQSTGKIDVAGQGTAAGEDIFTGPREDTWDTEGILDFSGFYVAVSLEFSF